MKRTLIIVSLLVVVSASLAAVYFFWEHSSGTVESQSSRSTNVSTTPAFFDAGPFKVRAEINPETPKVGKNKVTVFVMDKDDQPVRNATLDVVAVMPSMGSMPAMYAPAEMVESSPGQYHGEFSPAMGGEWPLTIDILAEGSTGSIIFDLATGRKGIRCATCGGAQDAETPGTIRVDPNRRQLIGISTGRVKRENLRITVRAAGRVTYDETHLSDITLKFSGWINTLVADSMGKPVTKGKPMFTVYSPDLLAAQEEYLETLKHVIARGKKNSPLLAASRRKLRLWDFSAKQIKALEKRGHAQGYVQILAPVNGVILEKNIVAGSAFRVGQQLLRIADLSRVWVEGQVYDYELPLIETGMKAKVVLPELQDRDYEGKVDFIYPFMEGDTRTARVRVALDNSDGFLRPEMYAHVHLKANLGERLVVPESAVLYAGRTRLVFLDLGDGRLQPRKIKTGQRNRKWIEVLEGLDDGDIVVTSGNFLIASESKLKAGIEQW